ncbi:MAG: T9SS type A sorting domain-containing protein [Bacteroidetes bacterium]|nr:T9SS type A sorting domain-containing protein [Bacteroidota bacterium]
MGTKLNYLNSTISIYDVNGKLLVDETIKDSQTKINTQDFSEGIYFFKSIISLQNPKF